MGSYFHIKGPQKLYTGNVVVLLGEVGRVITKHILFKLQLNSIIINIFVKVMVNLH